MISLHLQNKEYLDRIQEYEEEYFIPHNLIDRKYEDDYWPDEWELGEDE